MSLFIYLFDDMITRRKSEREREKKIVQASKKREKKETK